MKSSFNSLQPNKPEKLRILVLDDDPVVRKVLGDMFSDDFTLQLTASVNEFNKIIPNFNPHIILLDVNLPDGNGINLCGLLRKSLSKKEVSILILTSQTDEKTVKKAYEAGADDYLRKPFLPFEVEAKLLLLAENIVTRKNLQNLFNEVKLYNKKFYRLTTVINENINEITKNDLLASLDDVVKMIGADYCEINLLSNPTKRNYKINRIQSDDFISFDNLSKRIPIIQRPEISKKELKVKNNDKEIYCYIYKIFFNKIKSGFITLQSYSPLHTESLNMLKLYLDFINMKGTDIHIRNQFKGEINKERKEVAKVRTIQVSLLPDFKDVPGFEISSTFIPMEEISGDFYDGFYLSESIYQLVVCDVCGHGMASSYIGSAIRSIIRTVSLTEKTLSGIVSRLNDILTQTTIETSYFATMFIWQVDLNECSMRYVSAGHPEALFYNSKTGEIESLVQTGPVVGLFDGCVYEEKELLFDKDNLLFVYTDGIIEATNPETGQLYGITQLRNDLEETSKSESTLDIIHSVLGSVYNFTDFSAVDDDMTIICMKKQTTCLPPSES